jgi:hypothetical protein
MPSVSSSTTLEVLDVAPGREGAWHLAEVHCFIPSGLHRLEDAQAQDLSYYAVFGVPEEDYVAGGRESYEPVRMRGRMYWRPLAERLTLAWGGLCPAPPRAKAGCAPSSRLWCRCTWESKASSILEHGGLAPGLAASEA